MSVKLNPYLSFDGNTREALEFYHDIFGGEIDLKTFGEYPDPPEGYENKIMHGVIESPDLTIMASEAIPGKGLKVGDNISLSLSGDDHDKLAGYFEKLSEGGHITMPLEKQMWGDKFGMVTDKFGIFWMVNISKAE